VKPVRAAAAVFFTVLFLAVLVDGFFRPDWQHVAVLAALAVVQLAATTLARHGGDR